MLGLVVLAVFVAAAVVIVASRAKHGRQHGNGSDGAAWADGGSAGSHCDTGGDGGGCGDGGGGGD